MGVDANGSSTFNASNLSAHVATWPLTTQSTAEATSLACLRGVWTQLADIDYAGILMVCDDLLRGSRNHLRGFKNVLQQQAGTCVPPGIGRAECGAIANSRVEAGA
jgi:hypothetical protein